MRLEELNWFDVEAYLQRDNRLMLVLGACEQHGYLSLASDVKTPLALADAASQQSGVLVAPPVNFGISPYFLNYPGTLCLRVSTLLEIVEDLIQSAYQQGFRRFLILNGHGGNAPAQAILYELANRLPLARFKWYSWWQSHSVTEVCQRHELKSFHAGWIEAFPFNRVSDLPPGEKLPPPVPGLLSAQQARETYGDGVFGGPYSVDPTILSEVFAAALADVLQLLEFDSTPITWSHESPPSWGR